MIPVYVICGEGQRIVGVAASIGCISLHLKPVEEKVKESTALLQYRSHVIYLLGYRYIMQLRS